MATLEKALAIAAQAHAGQQRKDGSPYVLHPLRMMMRLTTTAEMIVALLHDVVEDSDWTLEQLRQEGFAAEIIAALDLLTHRPQQSYQEYIDNIAANPLARKAKIVDLEDNMDLRQLPTLSEKAWQRSAKYHRCWLQLTAVDRESCPRGDDEH